MLLEFWYLKQNLGVALQTFCRSLKGRNVHETYFPSGKCFKVTFGLQYFLYLQYVFVYAQYGLVCLI